jgi:hypothetical protein
MCSVNNYTPLTYRRDWEKGNRMKLKVIFKGGTIIKINDATSFAVNGDTENILRVDTADGRAHFINFHEVLACLEVKEETE